MEEIDYKNILLQFIGTLALDCEDPKAVTESITAVLEAIDMDIEWNDLNDLASELGKLGVTTLHGTSLYDEDEEDDWDFEEEDEDFQDEDDDESYY